MSATEPYNPLEKEHLGESVADALLRCDPHSLSKVATFKGAGLYAIYYTGGFAPYRAIAKKNQGNQFELPIYVGKAVPPRRQKGKFWR